MFVRSHVGRTLALLLTSIGAVGVCVCDGAGVGAVPERGHCGTPRREQRRLPLVWATNGGGGAERVRVRERVSAVVTVGLLRRHSAPRASARPR